MTEPARPTESAADDATPHTWSASPEDAGLAGAGLADAGLADAGPDAADAPVPLDEGVTSPPLEYAPWAGLPAVSEASSWASSYAPTEPTDAPTEPSEPTDAPTEPTDAPTEPSEPTDAPTEPSEPTAAVEPAVSDDLATTDLPTTADVATTDDLATPEAELAAQPVDVVPTAAGRSRWATARLASVAVALVATLVLGGLSLWVHVFRSSSNRLTDGAAKAATAAATTVAVPLLSYDYRTIDQQTAKLAKLQTSTCATQYANDIDKAVKPLATQNQAVMTAQVLSVGVRSASADTVSVLAFIQTTSSSKAKTTKEINEIQLTLTMVKQHGSWLLASTSANGSGAASGGSC